MDRMLWCSAYQIRGSRCARPAGRGPRCRRSCRRWTRRGRPRRGRGWRWGGMSRRCPTWSPPRCFPAVVRGGDGGDQPFSTAGAPTVRGCRSRPSTTSGSTGSGSVIPAGRPSCSSTGPGATAGPAVAAGGAAGRRVRPARVRPARPRAVRQARRALHDGGVRRRRAGPGRRGRRLGAVRGHGRVLRRDGRPGAGAAGPRSGRAARAVLHVVRREGGQLVPLHELADLDPDERLVRTILISDTSIDRAWIDEHPEIVDLVRARSVGDPNDPRPPPAPYGSSRPAGTTTPTTGCPLSRCRRSSAPGGPMGSPRSPTPRRSPTGCPTPSWRCSTAATGS